MWDKAEPQHMTDVAVECNQPILRIPQLLGICEHQTWAENVRPTHRYFGSARSPHSDRRQRAKFRPEHRAAGRQEE